MVTTQRTVASSAPHPSTGPDPAAARDPLGLRARARRSALLLVVLVASRHLFARIRIERFVVVCWAGLIPLALLNIFVSGAWLL